MVGWQLNKMHKITWNKGSNNITFANITCFHKQLHLCFICRNRGDTLWEIRLWHTLQAILRHLRLHLTKHLPDGFASNFFILWCLCTPRDILHVFLINSCIVSTIKYHFYTQLQINAEKSNILSLSCTTMVTPIFGKITSYTTGFIVFSCNKCC